MESVSNKLRDFSGQNIYVGMDVHDKSWKIHIFSDEFELKSFSQEPSVDRLGNYLNKQYKGANLLLAYESGFSGFWIQRAFQAKGIDCRVIHAADVPTNNKEQIRKSDAVDSKKIAKGLKNHDLNFIHVPEIQLELDRQLVRSRLNLSKDSTRIKNRIKALLKLHGINISSTNNTKWSQKFICWLNAQIFASPSGNLAMQNLINELQFLTEQKNKVDISIKELSQSFYFHENVTLLLSIPSIGQLTAMILLTELGDINRFKRFDDLASYCGLTPNCHESGETKTSGGLSHRGNARVKNVLIECAWVAVRKDPALLLFYKEQIKRMKAQKAIIKVTRKLLSRIRYVLTNKMEYELGIIK
jgi:transposase